MRYQIDEQTKKITFECATLNLVELMKHVEKLTPSYPDIKTWSFANQESFSTVGIEEVAIEDLEVPEKPEEPDFDFDENMNSKKEDY